MNWILPVALLMSQATIGVLIQRGQTLHEQKKFADAAAAYKEALNAIPGDQTNLLAMIHDLRAQSLEAADRNMQAIQEVQQALRYKKNDPKLLEHLARLQLNSSKSIASAEDIQIAMMSSRGFSVEPDMGTQPGQNPAVITPPVNFDFNKDTLTAMGQQQVANLATAMKSLHGGAFKLVGHTDAKGTPDYNDKLSMRRAVRVKAELVNLGLGAGQISVVGMGSRQLVSPGKSEDDHARNRRVELIVVR